MEYRSLCYAELELKLDDLPTYVYIMVPVALVTSQIYQKTTQYPS
jgi:hypothetical protein